MFVHWLSSTFSGCDVDNGTWNLWRQQQLWDSNRLQILNVYSFSDCGKRPVLLNKPHFFSFLFQNNWPGWRQLIYSIAPTCWLSFWIWRIQAWQGKKCSCRLHHIWLLNECITAHNLMLGLKCCSWRACTQTLTAAPKKCATLKLIWETAKTSVF